MQERLEQSAIPLGRKNALCHNSLMVANSLNPGIELQMCSNKQTCFLVISLGVQHIAIPNNQVGIGIHIVVITTHRKGDTFVTDVFNIS